jgi:hypothetical protein
MARRLRKGPGLERAAPSERQDVDPDPFDGLGGAHLASEADREITTLWIQVARLEASQDRALDAPPEYCRISFNSARIVTRDPKY